MTRKALFDNHGREVNYLRVAVTDRCNLRCFYCMPEEGINYVPRQDLLTYEELLRFIHLMAGVGVHKVRITGGEPFVRKDMMEFIEAVSRIPGVDSLHLTTNGTTTYKYIDRLVAAGVKSINLSLDTLDRDRFLEITRRDQYDNVMQTFDAILASGIRLKVNAVVMDGRNTEDIVPFVELGSKVPFEMRFIEQMPFDGKASDNRGIEWNHVRILQEIHSAFPGVEKLPDPPFATASLYQVPNFAGTFGIIAAYTRTFCGTCNRLRLTPQGTIKTCLYDNGVFNLRKLMRAGATDDQVVDTVIQAIGNRAKDGWEAERSSRTLPISESMSTIGG